MGLSYFGMKYLCEKAWGKYPLATLLGLVGEVENRTEECQDAVDYTREVYWTRMVV